MKQYHKKYNLQNKFIKSNNQNNKEPKQSAKHLSKEIIKKQQAVKRLYRILILVKIGLVLGVIYLVVTKLVS